MIRYALGYTVFAVLMFISNIGFLMFDGKELSWSNASGAGLQALVATAIFVVLMEIVRRRRREDKS